jgi:hypothetical protein
LQRSRKDICSILNAPAANNAAESRAVTPKKFRSGLPEGKDMEALRIKTRAKTRRPLIARIERRIDRHPGGCWLWRGAVLKTGYGRISLGALKDGQGLVHRLMYEHVRGPIPAGMELDHLCRVRHCCNPAHVEPVPHAVNVRRGAATKLSQLAVLAVRALAAQGDSQRDIASLFDINQATVNAVVNRKTWK